MKLVYTPYILPLVLASALLILTVVQTWRFRDRQIGRIFLLLLAALFIWSSGFAFEIMAVSLAGKLLWANLQFFGILPLPLLWLGLTLLYTGQPRSIRSWTAIISIPIVITCIALWTNSFHHLFRLHPYIDCSSGPFCVLVNDYGPLFYINAGISYLVFISCLVLMGRSLAMKKTIHRQQLLLLMASLFVPLLSDFLYVNGISPIPHFNFTPITFSLALIFVAIALFRFRLLSLRPLAYDLIIENLRDGILILDDDNIIVDINPAAEKFLGITS
jgi:PAS domain-containing protein